MRLGNDAIFFLDLEFEIKYCPNRKTHKLFFIPERKVEFAQIKCNQNNNFSDYKTVFFLFSYIITFLFFFAKYKTNNKTRNNYCFIFRYLIN